MAWTDYYVDLALTDAKGSSGAASAVSADPFTFTPGVAPGWAATGNPLAGRTINIAAGSYVIATHNATAVLTWTGSAPAENATAGAWRLGVGSTADPFGSYGAANLGIAAAWGGTTATYPTRIYVRGNQTSDADVTMNLIATSAYPIYWVGCTGSGTTWTRIGNDATTAKPLLTLGANQFLPTGAGQVFEGLAWTGSDTSGTVYSDSNYHGFIRCRSENTANSANAGAWRFASNANYIRLIACSSLSSSTTNEYSVAFSGTYCGCIGCYIEGGVSCGLRLVSTACFAIHNIIYCPSTAAAGIKAISSSMSLIFGNTIYGPGADGINLDNGNHVVCNNLIVGLGNMDSPINYVNATPSSMPLIAFNAWYNVATDKISGIIESQAEGRVGGAAADAHRNVWNTGLLGTDPLPNVTSPPNNINDFDLAYADRALAFPGTFEAGAYAFAGFADHGALKRQIRASDLGLTAGILVSGNTIDDVVGTYPTAAQIAAAMWDDDTSPDRTVTA